MSDLFYIWLGLVVFFTSGYYVGRMTALKQWELWIDKMLDNKNNNETTNERNEQ